MPCDTARRDFREREKRRVGAVLQKIKQYAAHGASCK